jgi:anti-anti-sigma regulatory factor
MESESAMVLSYGNRALECGGAQLSAQSRHLATLLTITGTVYARNVDRLYEHSGCFVLPDTGFVLDLSGVTSFAAEGARLVSQIDEACRAIGIEWALVASRVVGDRLAAGDAVYPFAGSVPEALQRFADGIFARRRLLLPLLTKSA